jgi:tetratricopeptide (TPR) repeat protein
LVRTLILFLALVFAPLGATAAPSAPAVAAYTAGDYLGAARLAEGAGSPADLTLAARSLIAAAVTGAVGPDVDPVLTRAIRNAERAVSADPKSVEGRLQWAVALGMKGRRATAIQALRAGWAERGKRLLDEAIRLNPKEAWSYALLGGWNMEVVRRGGVTGAAMFGADVKAGRAAFERARTMAPQDAAIAYQYAAALLEMDARRNAPEARALLVVAAAAQPQDAFQAFLISEARRIKEVLDKAGPQSAAKAVATPFERLLGRPHDAGDPFDVIGGHRAFRISRIERHELHRLIIAAAQFLGHHFARARAHDDTIAPPHRRPRLHDHYIPFAVERRHGIAGDFQRIHALIA